MTRPPTALDLPPVDPLPPATARYFGICEERLGFVPSVLQAYAFDIDKLNAFTVFYNQLMLADSGLSLLDREMIAATVSATNHCHSCQVSHGAAVRKLSGDPALGETLITNYRSAELSPRQRAMLDFAVSMTEAGHKVEEADRQHLRDAGFSDRDIWDIAAVAAFFNMTNRMASATGLRPNADYFAQAR